MPKLKPRALVRKSKQVLASSRANVRQARNRIERSRNHLSDCGDAIVRSASQIGAARSSLRRR